MPLINFYPFPIFTTERLTLRPLKDSDDEEVFSLRSDDRINKYIKRQKQTSIEEAKAFILKINDGVQDDKWIYWAICLKDKPKLIGTICLWNFSPDQRTAEVGYELNPAFQGKGLMNEALKCIIHYSLKIIGLQKLEAFTHKNNHISIRLLEKNNFKPDFNRKEKENDNNVIFTLK